MFMKWLVTVTLVVASVSILVPVLFRYSESARANGRLEQIHETAAV